MSDSQTFISRCKRQEPEALRELAEQHGDAVYRIALHLLGDEEQARDAAQEAFLNAFRALPKFRGESSLKTWVLRIAHNECINRSRKSRRWRERIIAPDDGVEEMPAPDARPFEDSMAAERRGLVQKAVSRLAEPFRSVIVLRYFGDMSYAEIAESLDAPLGSVKSWVHRASAQLADDLEWLKDESS